MSAASVARPWDPLVEGRRFSPAEGWLTVAMVVLLVESFVWALQDAGWVPSAQGSTSHLTYLAMVAILLRPAPTRSVRISSPTGCRRSTSMKPTW